MEKGDKKGKKNAKVVPNSPAASSSSQQSDESETEARIEKRPHNNNNIASSKKKLFIPESQESVDDASSSPPKKGKKNKKLMPDDKKIKRKRKESFSMYIYKVLKSVHPSLAISRNAMIIMNNFVVDIFERLAQESSLLVKHAKSKTLSSREIQTATKLILPGELSKHAISEAVKAVMKYNKDSVRSHA